MSTTNPLLVPVGVSRLSQRGERDDDELHTLRNQDAKQHLLWNTQGWDTGHIYHEDSISGGARLEDRPGLLAAVTDIEEGRAHILTVAYRDRFDREPAVRDEVIDRVEAKGGIVWAADYGRDTNATPAQQFSGTVLSAAGRMERQQAKIKSRDAVASALAEGIYPKPYVPPGFRRGPDRKLVPHDVERLVIEELFALRLAGTSIDDLQLYLRSHGITRTHGGVRKMLANKVYVGEIHHGSYKPNLTAHEPIVDRDVFDDVQEMVMPRGPRSQRSDALAARQKVLRCKSCRKLMVASARAGHGSRYRCSSRVSPDCTDRQVILGRYVDEVIETRMRSRDRRSPGDAQGSASTLERVRAAAARTQELDDALQTATKRALLLGLSEEAGAKEALAEMRAERDEARALEAELMKVADAEKVHVNLGRDWDDLSLAEQRELIRTFVVEVIVGPGRGRDRVHVRMLGE